MSVAAPDTQEPVARACADCLRRTWLVGRLAGAIEIAVRGRAGRPEILALPDEDLIAAVGARMAAAVRCEHARFDAEAAAQRCVQAGLSALCRCDHEYPRDLAAMPDAPAVLHVRGRLERFAALSQAPRVAVVGARRASDYGLEVGRALGRGVSSAGVTVVSGMALGIDSTAHAGALEAGGHTIAVLAGGADVPYPPSKRRLYARIAASGCVIAELPPGTRPFRWCFPARNRIIAGLAELTIVVEAGERSGSLITAGIAHDLGRTVAAVPGRVTASLAHGTNGLIFDGAAPIRGAQDVLDLLLGTGAVSAAPERDPAALEPRLRSLLVAVSDGCDTLAQLGARMDAGAALVGLAELELLGFLARGPGGRYALVP